MMTAEPEILENSSLVSPAAAAPNPRLQEAIALLFAAHREPDPMLKPHLVRSALRNLEFLEHMQSLGEYR